MNCECKVYMALAYRHKDSGEGLRGWTVPYCGRDVFAADMTGRSVASGQDYADPQASSLVIAADWWNGICIRESWNWPVAQYGVPQEDRLPMFQELRYRVLYALRKLILSEQTGEEAVNPLQAEAGPA